jgi:hypothetical protein
MSAKQIPITVDQKKSYASPSEVLLDHGYSYAGTTTVKGSRKNTVKQVYSKDGQFFMLQKCEIERYKVKKLSVAEFSGELDRSPEPAQSDSETKADIQE